MAISGRRASKPVRASLVDPPDFVVDPSLRTLLPKRGHCPPWAIAFELYCRLSGAYKRLIAPSRLSRGSNRREAGSQLIRFGRKPYQRRTDKVFISSERVRRSLSVCDEAQKAPVMRYSVYRSVRGAKAIAQLQDRLVFVPQIRPNRVPAAGQDRFTRRRESPARADMISHNGGVMRIHPAACTWPASMKPPDCLCHSAA